MKMLIVTGIFPPDIGGPASYVPAIAKEFNLRGHQIKIITFSNQVFHQNDHNVSYQICRVSRRQSIILREIKFLLRGLALAKNCDVIYANGNNFKAYLIAKICNKPIAHKIVGDTAWERAQNRNLTALTIDEYQSYQGGIKIKFYNWVRSYPLTHSDLIITPSNYLAKMVEKWAPSKKTRVIYNSVEPLAEIHSTAFPNKENTILMVGRLVSWKKIDQVICCISNSEYFNLMIIGDGPLRRELENLSKNLNIDHRVFFLGHKSHHEIYGLMKNAFALLINSSYEGLPHIALEAFQVKLPVIATNVGGNSEVIIDGKTGILIPFSDQNSLKEALFRLKQMDTKSLCQNAQSLLLEKFSFEKMIHETLSALQEIACK